MMEQSNKLTIKRDKALLNQLYLFYQI